ncbi:hypothetical protein [Neisseria lactamica]|uniref:hypothetical protein n=1 Tax=Neisseria lactamica TaxID=486 RepID=UPI001864BAEA|nr:hypothetical protein [Neisseria lactamica]VTX86976.1 Uncharacterised protein [Neisseria subflava]
MAEKEKLAEYRKKYEAKRVHKRVSFNLEKELHLLRFVEKVDFSQWVKEKIEDELKK